jgi:hypothetical protein
VDLLKRLAGRDKDKGEAKEPPGAILDRHFALQEQIEMHYRERDRKPGALDAAIRACEQQIALAPQSACAWRAEYGGEQLPRHVGYEQLAIIREKQKDYPEAIRLSRMAREQGWAGDWDARIARCEKKAAR